MVNRRKVNAVWRAVLSLDPRYIENCRGVIKFLDAAVRNMAVYPPEHPSVTGVCQRVHENLGQILADREEIALGIVNGVLYVDDYHFSEPTPYSENFLKTLLGLEIDDLAITRGVTREDILNFAGILVSSDRGREAFLGLCREKDLRHIGSRGFVPKEEENTAADMVSTYQGAVSTVIGFFKVIREGRLPLLSETLALVDGFRKYLPKDKDGLFLMTCLQGYEHYTEQHCVNVCLLSMLLAQEEGFDEQQVGWAALAGLMHDTGMIKVPRHIAEKVSSLTLGERETFKSHPVHSAGIVHGMGGPEEVVQAVERHHTWFGGGGYPSGLEREAPPPAAGLVSVADTYDALTSIRPYKKPMDPVQALSFLEKGRGSRFDPRHVDAFRSLAGSYPPGTMVRLSSNEIGVVIRAGEDPGRPSVNVLVDEAGMILEDRWVLDLADDEVQGRVIAGVVDPALYDLRPEAIFAQG